MTKVLLFLAPTLLAIGWQIQDKVKVTPAKGERAAVERAMLDYCEAFYECKPEYIERSVSKDLTKYGYWQKDPSQAFQGTGMNFEQAVALAGAWNKDGSRADASSPKKIEIFDILDQTASGKLTAAWGIDYFHLAKEDGKWKIRNVLWQSHPLEQ